MADVYVDSVVPLDPEKKPKGHVVLEEEGCAAPQGATPLQSEPAPH